MLSGKGPEKVAVVPAICTVRPVLRSPEEIPTDR